jgi:cation diffusion facilitator family transporter
MAGAKPDPEHPFGHGRIEYISGLAVSAAILIMAYELIRDSIGKIIRPEDTEFSLLVVGVLVASILVKLYMYYYNSSIGKKIDSAAMRATAVDSLSDTCATTVVLLATLVGHFANVHIDGWCGVLVGCFILYAGVSAARETLNPLLGQPPEPEFVQRIEEIVMEHDMVCGIHDLIVHDYGPGRKMISLHAEVRGR